MNLSKNQILKYAKKYDDRYRGTEGKSIEIKMKRLLRRRKHLTRNDLIDVGCWKSKRIKKWLKSDYNDNKTVKDITRFCLNPKTKSEKARIEALLILKGVSWPVASAILHFTFPRKYPILDFRALWSLGWTKPPYYDFAFWQRYSQRITLISKRLKLSIRTVDKALWEYSKENQ